MDRIHPATIVSEHFRVYDFLRSDAIPELRHYELTGVQFSNLMKIATNILEPLWNQYGQIIITSGGRPVDLKDPQGRGFYELLQERGYSPSEHSQHNDFSAVDIKLLKKSFYRGAFLWLMNHPAVRQVILYLNEYGYPTRMHVGVITPMWPATDKKALLHTSDNRYVQATTKEIQSRLQV